MTNEHTQAPEQAKDWREEWPKYYAWVEAVGNGSGPVKQKAYSDFIAQLLAERDAETERRVQARSDVDLCVVLDALADMYGQYCDHGHDFMSAGELASSVLDHYRMADFDDAGRASNWRTPAAALKVIRGNVK